MKLCRGSTRGCRSAGEVRSEDDSYTVAVEGVLVVCMVESMSVHEPRVSASQAAQSVNLACDLWRWSSA